ncbi:MAG TPA: BON domain-containing protein [Chloroflexota bacterium]|nr:BON domain-containing protein [Chloroflexota bacterium]
MSPPRDRGSLQVLLQAAARAGTVPAELANYVRSTLDLAELQVRDAMVPRVDVVAVPDASSAAETARQMGESGRTRLPVYRDTIDRPIGVVHAVDVAQALANATADRSPPSAGQLARATPTIPETASLLEAIQAMRSQATHLLLVLDQQGGFAGLTTLEDVAEQVLGPLPAERGAAGRNEIQLFDDGVALVGGATPLHRIERILNVRFPNSRFVSIGGLVLDRLGRVPRPGDVVQLPGMRIEVLSVDSTRVRELRIRTGLALGMPGRLIEVGLGKEVVCGTDVVGRVERLITDTPSGRVERFVVRHRGRPVVVPLTVVERTDDGVVYLSRSGCELDQFPTDEAPAISEETEVVCDDGSLGRVQHVLLDALSGAATHIVVRLTSGLLKPHEVIVPLSWARSITPPRIELACLRDDLLGLPEYRDDDEIEVDVLRRLTEDQRFQGLDRYTLKATVKAGVVRLTGRVRTTEHSQAAEQLVSSVRGVLAVHNELLADEELARRVECDLNDLKGAGVQLADLDIAVLLGQVKLRGRAATSDDRAAAERIARAVPGVESVTNELVVDDDQATQ